MFSSFHSSARALRLRRQRRGALRRARPFNQIARALDDLHGHFVVAAGLAALAAERRERLHLPRGVLADGFRRDAKIEPLLVEEPEELAIQVKSGAAEHRPRNDVAELAQLIEHERAEAAFRKNAGTSGAFGHDHASLRTHDTRE